MPGLFPMVTFMPVYLGAETLLDGAPPKWLVAVSAGGALLVDFLGFYLLIIFEIITIVTEYICNIDY